jgi:hypothetical protein
MRTRAWFVALLVSATCSALLFAQTPALKQYVYSDDGFVIAAPTEPKFDTSTQTTALGTVQMHGYTVDLGNDSGFVVYAADFKRSTGISVQGGKEGFLANLKARVITEKTITLAGQPGIEFEWENPEYHGRAQMFFVGGILFQLLSIAPINRPVPPVVDGIFRSFRFLQGAA